MAEVTQSQIEAKPAQALRGPLSGAATWSSAKCIKSIAVAGDTVTVEVVLGFPAKRLPRAAGCGRSKQQVESIDGSPHGNRQGVQQDRRPCGAERRQAHRQHQEHHRRGLRQGRGGQVHHGGQSGAGPVGRRRHRRHAGRRYLRSQPAAHARRARQAGIAWTARSLEPMVSYHLQAMSIGFLIDEETPMIWRGPMVTQALQQLLHDTNWTDLDYLVIDLPPGTGDIQLTLAQQVPVSRRGHRHHAAGHRPAGRAQGSQDVREGGGAGARHRGEHEHPHLQPSAATKSTSSARAAGSAWPSSTTSISSARCRWTSASARRRTTASPPWSPSRRAASRQIYREIARRTAAKLSLQAKDYAAKFPQIVIQND